MLANIMGEVPITNIPEDIVVDGMGDIIARTSSDKNYKNAIQLLISVYATQMVNNNKI